MRRSLAPLKLLESPLVVVLAQVRIAPVLQMKEYVPKIQESLRRVGYPRFGTSQLQELVLGPGAAEPSVQTSTRWLFLDRDNVRAVVVAPEFITFETTAYDTFDSFMEAFETALATVGEIAEVSLSERVGLRYVDAIRPRAGEGLDMYLHPGLLGLDASSLSLEDYSSRMEARGKTGVGEFVFRVTQPAVDQEQPPLPPDLLPLDLAVPEGAMKGVRAILDFDHFSVATRDYETASLVELMWDLHDLVDQAFRGAVTEDALKTWGAKEL